MEKIKIGSSRFWIPRLIKRGHDTRFLIYSIARLLFPTYRVTLGHLYSFFGVSKLGNGYHVPIFLPLGTQKREEP